MAARSRRSRGARSPAAAGTGGTTARPSWRRRASREMCGASRCQGCDFCQGYAGEPCDGHRRRRLLRGVRARRVLQGKGRVALPDVPLPRLRFCVAMTSPPPPAAAGEQCVLAPGSTPAYGDTPFPACQQFCSPAKATEHCALCKCQACSFCKEMAKPCATSHVADTAVEECDGWCHTLATNGNTELACSFCRCAKCSFCPRTSPFGGPYRRDATPRTVDHHVADAGCAGDGAGASATASAPSSSRTRRRRMRTARATGGTTSPSASVRGARART